MSEMNLQFYCDFTYAHRGAVCCRADYYPVKHGKARSVFAYRFFNRDNNEVAWYCPDTGGFHLFSKPRVWPFHAVALLPEADHKALSAAEKERMAEMMRRVDL